MCSYPSVWRVHVNVQRVRKVAHYTLSCTHRSFGSLPNYINTWLTPHLHEHIGQSDKCTFTCTHQVHVNVQWPVCACKCAESQKIRWLHTFMHTSVIGLTAQLHEHIRESNHCTVRWTHQVHVSVQWPVCLTCTCICAENKTIGSLHIFMHISVTRLTPHLHEHIGQSDKCTFTCTHQVHVNVQLHKCLTSACKCAPSLTID